MPKGKWARPARPPIKHPTDPTLALVPLTMGEFAVISVVDVAAVSAFKWRCRRSEHTSYAVAGVYPPPVHLHRLIAEQMGLDLSATIDHINGNGLDCRRSNLRSATRSQNKANSTVTLAASGVKGVHRSRDGRWIARVTANKVVHYLGTFDSIEEAAEARRLGVIKYQGEFGAEMRLQ